MNDICTECFYYRKLRDQMCCCIGGTFDGSGICHEYEGREHGKRRLAAMNR
jgi:hypothetical protein